MKKVILFGGTFDPIHYGHLHIAKEALKQRNADEVWFIVSAQSPFKLEQSSFKHRFKMVQMMIYPFKRFVAIDIENKRPTPSYSIDTVHELMKGHHDVTFEWLIGSDHVATLDQWHDIEALKSLVSFVVYPRDPSFITCEYPLLEGVFKDVSSTDIRLGYSTATKPQILNYFVTHNLYTNRMLQERLSEARYQHVQRVLALALDIGSAHHLPIDDITTAVLWHDMFKETQEMRSVLSTFKRDIQDLHPAFEHAYKARAVLSRVYYYRNKHVLNAISEHVSGNATNPIAMVLYIADKCEPGRGYDASHLIALSKQNLRAGFKAVKAESEAYRRKHNGTKTSHHEHIR